MHKNARNIDTYESQQSAGVDFDYLNGLFVEMKTTQTSPNYLQQFELAASETAGRQGTTMRFEIYYFEGNSPPEVSQLIAEIPRLEAKHLINIDDPVLISSQKVDYP